MRRRLRSAFYLLILFALIVAYAWSEEIGFGVREIRAANGEKVDVRDGDTLLIGQTKFRIFGIDAPELHQTCRDAAGKSWACGIASRDRLNALFAAPGVGCTPRARDRFGREIATCRTNATPDVGKLMVAEGLAIDFSLHDDSEYEIDEAAAKAAKLGMWKGSFERPQDWRTTHPRTDAD